MAVKPDYPPVPAWLPIIRELVNRGVTDVAVLIFTLTYRDIELESGERIESWDRLVRAIPTLALALEKPVDQLLRELVARAADIKIEPLVRAEAKAIAPRLENLPGVKTVGPLDFGPYPLCLKFRRLGEARGIPVPKWGEASVPWTEVLTSLRKAGSTSDVLLTLAANSNRVTLKSGAVLEPISQGTLDETLARVLETPAQVIRKRVEQRLVQQLDQLADLQRTAGDALRALPDVAAVAPARAKPMKLPTPGYEGPDLDPPWTAFPEPPTSMRWRMGGGEDVVTRWWWFWDGLGPDQRSAYFEKWPPPAEWGEWANRALAQKEE